MTRFALTLFLVGLVRVASLGCAADVDPPKCTRTEDCAVNEICLPDGTCQAVQCVDDAACLAQNPRKVCDVAAHVCQFREGFADECDDQNPCAFGQFCSTHLGRCLDSASARDCTRRGQCPAGQVCDVAASKCVPDLGCYGYEFCEAGEVCDLSIHRCRRSVTECRRCDDGGACPGASRCVTEKKECVPAGADPTCGAGEFCDPLSRCVQCTNSSQCGIGLYCNAAIGRCESQIQCADDPSRCPTGSEIRCVICEAPEICEPRTKRCQAPPRPCDDDTMCESGEYCDKTQNPPICVARALDCLADLLEPNNAVLVARALAPATPLGATVYSELKLCPGDVDWYRLDVAGGTYLSIDARFFARDGDVDMQVFLQDGTTLVQEARSVTDNERVELDVGTDATLLLRVFLAAPVVLPVPYRLVVTRDPSAMCADDGHEPDDALALSKVLASDSPYAGRACSADPDWFVLRDVSETTRIEAALWFTRPLGDLDLALFRANSAQPIRVGRPTTNGVELTFDATFRGDYFLRVVGVRADTNVYTLRAQLRPTTKVSCEDDPFEANNDPREAARLSLAQTTTPTVDLTMCTGDDDWYSVSLAENEGVRAEIAFGIAADLELSVYGPGATRATPPIRASFGSTPREFVTFRAAAAGDHLLRVHARSPDMTSLYDLFVDRLPSTSTCAPDDVDRAGRGNRMDDPYTLGFAPLRSAMLTMCAADVDWYRLFLAGDHTNVVRLQYADVDATLDFTLFTEQGTPLISTAGAGVDVKEEPVNVGGSGFAVVLMQVARTAGRTTSYNVSVDIIPRPPCRPDRLETNNSSTTASRVTATATRTISVADVSLCATTRGPNGWGDEDWYVIQPPTAQTRMTTTLTFERGDLLLELFSPKAVRRACFNFGDARCYSDGLGQTEMVTFTATTTEPYFLRVSSVYSSPAAVILPLEVDTPYRLKVEYSP